MMKRVIFSVFYVFLLKHCLVDAIQNCNKKVFVKNTAEDNKLLDSGLLLEVVVSLRVECVSLSHLHEGCNLILYNPSRNLCRLHHFDHTSQTDAGTSAPGWRNFARLCAGQPLEPDCHVTNNSNLDSCQSCFNDNKWTHEHVNKPIPAVSESTSAVTESTSTVTESTPADTELTQVVTESTSTPAVSKSTSTGTESTTTVTESTSTVAESTSTESTSTATESTSPVTESTSTVTESTSTVTESTSTPAVSQSTSTGTESTTTVTESTSTVIDSTSTATESTSTVTELTSTVTESTPTSTELTQAVTDSTSTATESTSPGTESTSTVTESTSTVAESTSTESTTAVTESTSTVTESTSTVTDSTSPVTESTSTVTESTSTVAESTSTELTATVTESTNEDMCTIFSTVLPDVSGDYFTKDFGFDVVPGMAVEVKGPVYSTGMMLRVALYAPDTSIGMDMNIDDDECSVYDEVNEVLCVRPQIDVSELTITFRFTNSNFEVFVDGNFIDNINSLVGIDNVDIYGFAESTQVKIYSTPGSCTQP